MTLQTGVAETTAWANASISVDYRADFAGPLHGSKARRSPPFWVSDIKHSRLAANAMRKAVADVGREPDRRSSVNSL
jgi:hypothetical protein